MKRHSRPFGGRRPDLKRVAALIISLDVRKLTLRHREPNEYWLDLVDYDQRRLAARLDQISHPNLQAARASGNRSADRRIRYVEGCSGNGGSVGCYGRGRGCGCRLRLVRL